MPAFDRCSLPNPAVCCRYYLPWEDASPGLGKKGVGPVPFLALIVRLDAPPVEGTDSFIILMRINDPKGGFQQALGDYRKEISRLAEVGITTVVVAGNEQQRGPAASSSLEEGLPSWDSVSPGSSLSYFGRSPDVITAAATDSRGTPGNYADDRIGDFSSHGYGAGAWNPTVAAPGVNQKSVEKGSVTAGTSFSAPYVAGVIALMKQADPSLRTAEIIEILKKTAAGIAPGNVAGGAGEVNPEAAIREVLRRAGRLPKAA